MAYTTIDKGSKYFTANLHTGNGSTQTITGLNFKPDLVWAKTRVAANSHKLYDSVRGVSKALYSNSTTAEANDSPYGVTSFNSDGFSLNDDSIGDYGVNGGSGGTYSGTPPNYVTWNWLGSNTTVSNTSGSITSTVSVNTTSGFSIVSYTGTATAGATVGHGLGAVPKMLIIKQRNANSNWIVYHVSTGNTGDLKLQATSAFGIDINDWNNTTPTSSVFTLGNGTPNQAGTMIAYCFAEVKGFSKFGSYTGNGSTDGTFIYTGFKPAFIMTKSYSGYTGYWTNFDSTRSPTNTGSTAALWPNASDAEGPYPLDILSNGFKIRTTSATLNQSAAGYIYMAFASNPFVTSGGIPVTAI